MPDIHENGLEKTILETADLLVIVIERQGHVVGFNGACQRLTGWRADEVLGRSYQFLIPHEQREAVKAKLSLSAAANLPNRHENDWLTKDGTRRRITWVNSLTPDASGTAEHLICTGIDITERKQAEEELRRTEARYRQLIESAHEFIWEVDRHGAFTYVSPQCRELLGYECAELMGKRLFEVMPAEEAQRVQQLFLEYATARQPFRNLEDSVCHKDGKLLILESNGIPIFADDGSCIGYRGMSRDITERKNAENALRESEARFRQLADLLPQVVFECDVTGRLSFVNRNAFPAFGYSEAEFAQGISIFQTIVPEDRERGAKNVRSVISGGPTGQEYTAVRKDGSTFPVLVYSAPVLSAGKPVGLRGIMVDLSERKRAEESLRESEERFRSLVEAAPEAMYVQSRGTFAYVNPAMLKLLGACNPEELLGQSLLNRIVGDAQETVGSAQRHSGRFVPQVERTYLRLDGVRVQVETTSVPMRFQGVEAQLVFVRDVTARKRAEEHRVSLEHQLQQAQKMEALGQLAGGVAHDFNNQLQGIIGYAELLAGKVEAPTLQKYARQLIDAGEKSADLVRQLLAFARKGQYQAIPVDVHAVIAGTIAILERSLPKNVCLKTSLDAEWPIVIGDASLLQSAFMNLALNARDAMPAGGDLSVRTTTVILDSAHSQRLGALVPGAYLQITFSDTGHGIAEELKKKIFEPFFTTKPTGKGTGLGLAVVYGTINRHGGAIQVASSPGMGASFEVYLPLASGTSLVAESPITNTPVRPADIARILIVDDEAVCRNLLTDVLSDLGYSVVSVASGADALSYYRAHAPELDLVILDMNMPGMNGLATLKALQAVNRQVKVLIASGYSAGTDIDEALTQGACGLLKKPVDLATLAQQIEQAREPRQS